MDRRTCETASAVHEGEGQLGVGGEWAFSKGRSLITAASA